MNPSTQDTKQPCTHESMKTYDGALGYEALVCRSCGAYFDQHGEHPADEWSTGYANLHP